MKRSLGHSIPLTYLSERCQNLERRCVSHEGRFEHIYSKQWHMIVDGHLTYFVKKIDDCIESRPSATDTTPNDMCTRTAGRAAPLNGDMLATCNTA